MKTYKVTIRDDGNIYWYNEKDQLHREDGPAIEFSNGDKYWFRNGLCHREDGPAVECSNGTERWYLNDIEYSEAMFNAMMNNLKDIADLKLLAEKHGYTLTPKK